MTSYKNLNELWQDTLANIGIWGHQLESRVGSCTEIIGFQAVLDYPLHNILFVPKRKFSLSYACAEMLWYLSGAKSIEMIQAYAPQYEKFAEDGIAYGAYGARWSENPGFVKEKKEQEKDIIMEGFGDCTDTECIDNQLYALIHLLKTNPNTRQAIMTMWDSGDLIHAIFKNHKDLPCTLSLIFFVRDHKLHLVATMRSNDAWLGLPYDIFCFTTLQRIIAAELELGMGTYVHQAGSEHIYEKNQNKITSILKEPCPLYPYPVHQLKAERNYGLQWNIQQALSMEAVIRKTAMFGEAYRAGKKALADKIEEQKQNEAWEKIDPLFKDLVFGAATKWIHIPDNWFNNPLYANCQAYTEEINDQT